MLHRLSIVGLIATVLCLLAPTLAGADARLHLEASGKARPEVLEALTERRTVGAFIVFDVAAFAGARSAAPMSRALLETWVSIGSESILARLSAYENLEVISTFKRLPAVAVRADATILAAAAADPFVQSIVLDMSGGIALAQTGPLVGATDVHADLGFRGAGSVVAVLDSGYDADHADLSDDLVGEQCFCAPGCCPSGSSSQSGAGAARDVHGHGTHVAGIVTAAGREAGPGIAPGAGIFAIRVLDNLGRFSTLANLANAFEFVEDNAGLIDVVNLSLSTDSIFSSDCDLNFSQVGLTGAADRARDAGVLLVAASGNNGSLTSMGSPACISDIISVGATYDADALGSAFSDCNDPTAQTDDITCFTNRNSDTDLMAPGAYVRSTRNGGGSESRAGTSMASPVVAGCAALMREVDPGISPFDIEAILKNTGKTITDPENGRGFQRVDCEGAVLATIEQLTTTTTSTTTSTSTSSITTTTMATVPECGDVNGDGKIVASDAQLTLSAAVSNDVACPLAQCDVTGDGVVLASDALAILKIAVGIEVVRNCPS
ncbi:MAG: subtilisin family serine protease [Hyphomicrobiaceae bacterium]|jgi:subtilisin family serine protease